MSRRIIVCVVGVALVLPIALAAADERGEARERIEQLVNEAREHDEIAARLRAEAEQLKRGLAGSREMPGPEQIERHMMELMEKAEVAERDGHPDEAAELRKQARRLADRLGEPQRPPRERVETGEARQRIAAMRREAEELERAGKVDEARRLWARSKEIEANLDRREPRDVEAEELKARFRELAQASERAAAEGNLARAETLRAQAEKLERQLRDRDRRHQGADVKREIAELRKRAAEAKEAGHPDQAEAMMAEARRLQEHMGGQPARRFEGDRAGLLERIERLEQQVERLSRAVAELLEIAQAKR